MLSYFPEMYPDELLYSAIARYHKLSGNTHICHTINDLFGNKSDFSSVILPAHLKQFSEHVSFLGISFEEILYKRTTFPFYALFQSDSFIQNVIRWSEEKSEEKDYEKYGMWRNPAKTPTRLRYCPVCFKEDSIKYGEPYWHRLHQMLGVSVCSIHKSILLDSDIPYASYSSKEYFCLTETFPAKDSEQLEDPEKEIAVQIANEIQWLLENFSFAHNLWIKNGESFRDIYLFFLRKKGLTTSGGYVRTNKFKIDFAQFYGKYLNLWDLDIILSKKTCWPTKMFQSDRRQFSFLRHVLMMKYLCGSVVRFFEMIHLYEEEPISEQITYKKSNSPNDIKREEYQRVWRTNCDKYPDYCKTKIGLLVPTAYQWLRRNDYEWLQKNAPVLRGRKRRSASIKNIDWAEKDEEVLSKLICIVETELQANKRPTRITKTRLAYSSEPALVITEKIDNLPKTREYIAQTIETRDAYRKRKLAWGANYLINNNEPIVMWKLMKLAGIPDRMWGQYWTFFQKELQHTYTYPLEKLEMSNQ